MDVDAELACPHPADAVFAVVEDLGTYPAWLDIVPRAVPGDDGSWVVDLRGRVGPLARSKRLRMVRTVHDVRDAGAGLVVFERAELDGREHAPWVLRADVTATGPAEALLTMHLHYGGGLWGPVLERLLGDTIARSRPRLLALLDQRAAAR